MNILLTSHFFYPSIGGIEAITGILAHHFLQSGHCVTVVTKTPFNSSYNIDSFHFEVVRNPSPSRLLYLYRWADVVLQNNIELNTLWPRLLVRKPVVIGLQTWLRTTKGKRSLNYFIKRIALAMADNVIACSNSIRTDSFKSATVIGNPYNSDLFRASPTKRRPNSIVFLGRLVSDKGPDLLIKAFSALAYPSSKLTIVGSGPDRDSLAQLVRKLSLTNSVNFTGALQGDDLVEVLNQHEIMVVPSTWNEPFGIVALEGLACGCVLLVSDGGGLPDAIGKSGLLFKRGDVTDLMLKLRLLLDRHELRDKLRFEAISHLPRFESSVISGQYLKILESHSRYH